MLKCNLAFWGKIHDLSYILLPFYQWLALLPAESQRCKTLMRPEYHKRAHKQSRNPTHISGFVEVTHQEPLLPLRHLQVLLSVLASSPLVFYLMGIGQSFLCLQWQILTDAERCHRTCGWHLWALSVVHTASLPGLVSWQRCASLQISPIARSLIFISNQKLCIPANEIFMQVIIDLSKILQSYFHTYVTMGSGHKTWLFFFLGKNNLCPLWFF